MSTASSWTFPPPPVEARPSEFTSIEWEVLRQRGAHDSAEAAHLLQPAAGPTHDPHLLRDIDRAVARLQHAVSHGERIAVYGDYDADGLTATAMLSTALEALGANVLPFIPSRFEEGYGLQADALARLRQDEGCHLVISVDCGVRAVAEVRAAQESGLDVIVTDHHEPGAELPPAVAVVNPKREDDSYPFKELSGVGLAYKVAQALAGVPLRGWIEAEALTYVAVGTIADIVSLTDENRTLVARGLDRLREFPPPGMAALMEVGGVNRRRLTARDVGFSIGPRLNAAGRLGSAMEAFRVLRARDLAEALPLAEQLDRANRERQDLTRQLLVRARSRLGEVAAMPALIFDADEDYGEGILGPAAAKLSEEWSRPAVLVSLRGESARGSARSVPGFHITEALEDCAHLLERFGGHAAAAGFSLRAERVPQLKSRLEGLAAERLVTVGEPPPLQVDAVVQPLDVNRRLLDFLDRLEPLGNGFPVPLFACLGLTVVDTKPVGRDKAHLRLTLRHKDRAVDAIAFRRGDRPLTRGERIDLAFYAERELYLGLESVRWNVQAIRPAQR